MQFDKPKVTIDLEEYQYLKEKITDLSSDENLAAHKKVISALLTFKGDFSRAWNHLSQEGISLSFDMNDIRDTGMGIVRPDSFSIKCIKKQKVEPTRNNP